MAPVGGSGMIEGPVAFLVDGDNVSPELVDEMLAEAAKYGTVTIRRIYGDWTSSEMRRWKPVLQKLAFVAVQQFANVAGKNATDSALIIDAMDILHRSVVKGFCIVSSDSDYTRLATHIRESDLFVMGIGEPKTPAAFRNACQVFVTTENLRRQAEGGVTKGAARKVPTKKGLPQEAVTLINKAFEIAVREDGTALLSDLGLALQRLDPAFDPRTYGYGKLLALIKALPEFEAEEAGTGSVRVQRKS